MAMEQAYWDQFQPLQTVAPGEIPPGTRPDPIPVPGSAGPGDGTDRSTPPATTAPPQTGAGRQQFKDAWFAYAATKPPNVTYVDWLKQFVTANPQYGVTIGGSKGDKVYGPGGEYWADAIVSAGINGGTGPGWSEETGGGGGGGADGYGDWTKPYGGQYTLPTLDELQHMPGYQAGLKAYTNGIQTSAASKGTLLTGGTLQRLGQAGTDYANQAYGQLASLQGGAFDRNYNIFRNNQTDPFNKYYSLAQLAKP